MSSARFEFSTEQWLPYPLTFVFAFFANPENLPRLMPRWQKARIDEAALAPPPRRPEGVRPYPGPVAASGSRLTLSFRPVPLSPVRLQWHARIYDFRWNEGFCDLQAKGPFRYWQQCRELQSGNSSKGEPGTILRDQIEYELPLGWGLSRLANLAVKQQIASLFRYRHKRTLLLLKHLAQQAE